MAQGMAMQLQQFLVGMDFPASRDEVASYAASQGADKGLLEKIEELPNKDFDTPDDITTQIDSETPGRSLYDAP